MIVNTPDTCNLYVREIGGGSKAILFLHGGWGADLEYLYNSFRYLKDDYRLIFYDQRGSLRSKCPDVSMDVKAHVDDLHRIIEELKLDSFSITAHSMGGYLALKYLESYPDAQIDKMILISSLPAVYKEEEMEREMEQARDKAERNEIDMLLDSMNINPENLTLKERYIYSGIIDGAINLYDIKRFPYLIGMVNFSRTAGTKTAESMESNIDFTRVLSETHVDVTFITGTDDYISVRSHISAIKNLPSVKLRVVPKAGHALWIDQPEIITEYIPEILK